MEARYKGRFVRQDNPPKGCHVTPIKKVGDKERFTVLVCSSEVFGIYTHWNEKRTVPCGGTRKLCKLCLKEVARRWAGFVHVCNPDGSGAALLEMTALAAERLLACAEEGLGIRGLIVHVYRERGTKKSPIAVARVGRAPAEQVIPRPIDPEPTLCKLWNLAA